MRKSTPVPAGPGPRQLTRRRLLAGAAGAVGALAAAGCTGTAGPSPTTTPSPGGSTDPDAALRVTVATAETALAARYARARAAYPALRRTLAVGDRHVSYAAAVLPAGRPSPSATAGRAPAGAAAALAELEAAERAAAKERLAQCGRAGDPELARVLALVGAGCAAAAESLGQARGG